jgi:phosphopantothenoylcysteine synthetase/decarboxylase
VPHSILWLRHVLGVEVRAILTRQAATMVAPRAIATASGHAVTLDDDGSTNDPAVPHIELTRWADVMLVLPASANLIGKAANGIADDVLTTCIIAAACPVVFVPSMNEIMWRKPAVQRNVATLQADGHGVIFPIEGIAFADGKPTVGAMPEIDDIAAWLAKFLQQPGAGQQPAAEIPANGFSFPDLARTTVEARV